ncbi:deoxyribose-phosphate aldolase [Marinilabiliaceae bacterium ANBcel2]|nr:deoxyribose-phosphate aldolase [Marinilabiliaceae bacterium ANBcel2]
MDNPIEPLFETFEEDFLKISSYDSSFANNPKNKDKELLKSICSFIDLTTLNVTDSSETVHLFCDKAKQFSVEHPQMPNVTAVCTYPVFASVLDSALRGTGIKRAVVIGSFPSSQTFLDIKLAEAKKAIAFGVDELDYVMSVGEFLEGNYEFVGSEISAIKNVAGDIKLKVIIESGILPDNESIWRASLLAMECGADFIKTSTGKVSQSASPEAAWIIAHAIKAYYLKRDRKIGFKVSGGISSVDEATIYYGIVKSLLGEDWLVPDYFRIGASRLADNLLNYINSSPAD